MKTSRIASKLFAGAVVLLLSGIGNAQCPGGSQGQTQYNNGSGGCGGYGVAPFTAFGAACDNSTDDSTAIYNAITDPNNSGMKWIIPPGRFCFLNGANAMAFSGLHDVWISSSAMNGGEAGGFSFGQSSGAEASCVLASNSGCTGNGTPVACCTGSGTGACGAGIGNSACTSSGTPYSCCTGSGTGTCVSGNSVCTASGTPYGCCTGSGTGTCGGTFGNSVCTGAGTPYSCCTGLGTGTCTFVNSLCTAPGAPYSCCTGSGTGTCTANSPCTGSGTPYPCCTGSGTGICTAGNSGCTASGAPYTCCTGAGTGTCPGGGISIANSKGVHLDHLNFFMKATGGDNTMCMLNLFGTDYNVTVSNSVFSGNSGANNLAIFMGAAAHVRLINDSIGGTISQAVFSPNVANGWMNNIIIDALYSDNLPSAQYWFLPQIEFDGGKSFGTNYGNAINGLTITVGLRDAPQPHLRRRRGRHAYRQQLLRRSGVHAERVGVAAEPYLCQEHLRDSQHMDRPDRQHL